MNSYQVSLHFWRRVPVIFCLGTMLALCSFAQDAGGSLGSSLRILRPKNPTVNKPKPKTPAPKATPAPAATRNPREREAPKPQPKRALTLAERIEDALEAGNDARDAKRFAQASKLYNSALALKKNEWRAAYGLGNLAGDQQLWGDAEKYYRQAAQLNGTNADIFVALSYVLAQPLPQANNANRLVEAEQAARRAVSLESKNAEAVDRLGLVLEERGILTAETENAYRRAVSLDENFALAYVHLALFLNKKGRGDEAAPLYEKAINLAQDDETLVYIADALQAAQRWSESETVLLKALQRDAKNPSALLYLARAQTVAKRYDEAETTLKKVIAVTPRNFSPHYSLGSVYLRTGRLSEAEKSFNEAASYANEGEKRALAGNFGFGGVGDEYARAGRRQDALRAYEKAVGLDPESKVLQEKLDKARKTPA